MMNEATAAIAARYVMIQQRRDVLRKSCHNQATSEKRCRATAPRRQPVYAMRHNAIHPAPAMRHAAMLPRSVTSSSPPMRLLPPIPPPVTRRLICRRSFTMIHYAACRRCYAVAAAICHAAVIAVLPMRPSAEMRDEAKRRHGFR